MPGSSGSLLLIERSKASGTLLNANANGMTCCLYAKMQEGVTFASPQSSTAYSIERDCERMVLPLAVERGEGMVVADSSVGAIASR